MGFLPLLMIFLLRNNISNRGVKVNPVNYFKKQSLCYALVILKIEDLGLSWP